MAQQPSGNFLPGGLPVPVDDGACDHLTGMSFPCISMPSTEGAGKTVDPSSLAGLTIIFCYPRTAAQGEVVGDDWNAIPGARGCTPQACSFRDLAKELEELGVDRVFGVSTQSTPYQQELKERTHLPYQLLSDEEHIMINALKLPTFSYNGTILIKRMSLAIRDGKIVKVWYPVFPSDRSASDAVEWLKTQKGS
ncbi:Hypothetical protein R9X50_00794800 [Acrodontium crateriforme]|uniref:Thioredoxin domain-containing protein n=1 Tax=Acrodontium crateriforme TaxID=150365 RepID=A0AAQ3MBY4_9PEZI|nr:Hypothetical protein R9X50_00794800 [Acrodontium crateriforme]